VSRAAALTPSSTLALIGSALGLLTGRRSTPPPYAAPIGCWRNRAGRETPEIPRRLASVPSAAVAAPVVSLQDETRPRALIGPDVVTPGVARLGERGLFIRSGATWK
jgi:hypothetical protein